MILLITVLHQILTRNFRVMQIQRDRQTDIYILFSLTSISLFNLQNNFIFFIKNYFMYKLSSIKMLLYVIHVFFQINQARVLLQSKKKKKNFVSSLYCLVVSLHVCVHHILIHKYIHDIKMYTRIELPSSQRSNTNAVRYFHKPVCNKISTLQRILCKNPRREVKLVPRYERRTEYCRLVIL